MAAQGVGVEPGLSLPDAYAIDPNLKTIDADKRSDKACLDWLLSWARRYTPWVALESLDNSGGASFWLDITGCTHLFGGEEMTLDDISSRIEWLGFSARLGLADTPGAAWAAAHFLADAEIPAIIPEGEQRTHLYNIPVSALRLSPYPLDTLVQLGIRTLADLLVLPRAPLTRRFGQEVCLRLDQLMGRVDEPLSPEMECLPYVARMVFPEPIGRIEDVERALRQLLESLCQRLEKDRKGLRRVMFELFRTDNTSERLQVGTASAVRQSDHLFHLFREKLDGLDTGFGVEFLLLTIIAVEPLSFEQLNTFQICLDQGEHQDLKQLSSGQTLALLVDRLEARLGLGRVVRPQVRKTHIPERMAGFVPALSKNQRLHSSVNDHPTGLLHDDKTGMRPGTRPIYLLPRPEPIRPLSLALDTLYMNTAPISGFEWRHFKYRLAGAEGPERIAGRWWHSLLPSDRYGDSASYFSLCKAGGAVRDYWRVESESGERFWVFHLPFPLASSDTDVLDLWFVHGLFA